MDFRPQNADLCGKGRSSPHLRTTSNHIIIPDIFPFVKGFFKKRESETEIIWFPFLHFRFYKWFFIRQICCNRAKRSGNQNSKNCASQNRLSARKSCREWNRADRCLDGCFGNVGDCAKQSFFEMKRGFYQAHKDSDYSACKRTEQNEDYAAATRKGIRKIHFRADKYKKNWKKAVNDKPPKMPAAIPRMTDTGICQMIWKSKLPTLTVVRSAVKRTRTKTSSQEEPVMIICGILCSVPYPSSFNFSIRGTTTAGETVPMTAPPSARFPRWISRKATAQMGDIRWSQMWQVKSKAKWQGVPLFLDPQVLMTTPRASIW